MLVLQVHLLDTCDDLERAHLSEALTQAVRPILPAACDGVTVLVHAHAAPEDMRGRRHPNRNAALHDPCAVVRRYLDAMETRDLDLARTFLGPDFVMTFPGTGRMSSFDELLAWSRPRYRSVAKTYAGIEACALPGASVVYARGTLSGEWCDGTPFAGIRFIDRFELSGGLITSQEVWNDMAEMRA